MTNPVDTRHDQARRDWEQRQQTLGNTPRAVLMKGIPDAVNNTFDRWHRSVLRLAYANRVDIAGETLDIGCGYGRLAQEMLSLGFERIIGIDFSEGFCRQFATHHGPAIRADLAHLPLAPATLKNAYAVTALMYLEPADARRVFQSLDASLLPGARVLVLEPGAEFNRLARLLLRSKRIQPLTRPGLSDSEFHDGIAPATWRCVAHGSNAWTTVCLPLLLMTARMPRLYAWLERIALRFDRPRLVRRARWPGRYAIYRWAIYDTPSVPGVNASEAARYTQGTTSTRP